MLTIISIIIAIIGIFITLIISERYYQKSQEEEPEWHLEYSSEYSLSPQEEKIKELLSERDPDLARIYEGALETFYTGQYPENLSQSAHSFRELTNYLPRHLDLPKLTLENEDGGDLTHREEMERIIAQTPDLEDLSPFVREQVKEKARVWHDLHENYFVKIAHHGRYGETRETDFEKKVSKLNDILLKVLPQHYTRSDEIKSLLKIQDPQEEDVENALELLMTQPSYVDFYSRVPTGWYEKLNQAGIFDEPPNTEVENGRVKAPRWPPAILLARLAEDKPDTFLRRVEKIECKNIRILDDLIDGFLKLPVSKSEQASKQISDWVKTPYFEKSATSAKLEDLFKKWLDRGRYKSVLILLEPLTELEIAGDASTEDIPTDSIQLDNVNYYQLKNHLDSIDFGNIDVGMLEEYQNLFIARLNEAIGLSLQRTSSEEDFSSSWRPAIEENDQNREGRDDLRELFLVQIKEIAEEIITKEPQKAEQIAKKLLSSSYSALQRIGLHLLRENFEELSNLTNKTVEDKRFFTGLDYHHEYYLLLEEHFGNLKRNTREQILEWITEHEGLDLEERRAFHKKRFGEEISEEELKRQFRVWKYERLYPIKDYLKADWKEEFEKLDEELQTPSHPEFQVYASPVWVGSKSPISQEEFSQKTPEEVKDYLLNWEPPGREFSLDEQSPSTRGLARALFDDVVERPKEYAKHSLVFKDKALHPQYFSQIFSGFKQSLDQDKSFNWENVLRLADWCVSVNWDGESHLGDSGTRWNHTVRKSIGWLLKTGLRKKDKIISEDLEEVVWTIVDSLLSDPEPDRDYEKEYGLKSGRPTQVAINTVRGTAMEALIYYCIWCSKIPESKLGVEFRSEDSGIPQKAIDKLEKHLNPEFERSLSIHSLFGRYLRILYSLDEVWVESKLNSIFPEDHRRWAVAWGAYIKFNNPLKKLFELLRPQYERALENLSELEEDGDSLFAHTSDYKRRLAGHIMASYWHSSKTINEHDLLNTFLSNAKDEVRAMAVRQLGNFFQDANIPKDSSKWEKIVEYWQARLKAGTQNGGNKKYQEEVSSFFSWFGNIPRELSGKILPLVKDSLAVEIDIEDVWLEPLLSYLSTVSDEEPEEVVTILEAVVKKLENYYWLSRSEEDCREILIKALENNERTRRKALNIINEFGRHGRDNFEDLWEEYKGY